MFIFSYFELNFCSMVETSQRCLSISKAEKAVCNTFIWLKKVTSIKNLPISFLKSNFELNQVWEKVFTQSH